MLVVPLRHETDFFALTGDKHTAMLELTRELQRTLIDTTDGPTFNVGIMRGGNAPNAVPDFAEAVVDIRFVPGQKASVIKKAIKELCDAEGNKRKGIRFKLEVQRGALPIAVKPDAPIVRAILRHAPKAQIVGTGGGTFAHALVEMGIDAVGWSPGNGRTYHQPNEEISIKQLTTYAHPGDAVLTGIDHVLTQAGLTPADVGLIIHGTTLATNALIQRNGAKTALLTTKGHRDALEMAHEDRFEQYDINIDRPAPLVPRYLRLPVAERLNHEGDVLIPLDENEVLSCLEVLDEHQVESVAIGYLHAFVNPQHELRTAELISRARPDISITLASEVCPEIREFERLSTACANAYVQPLMARYLERLAAELKQRGFACPFLLMTSGGGLTTLATAVKFPIRILNRAIPVPGPPTQRIL